MAKKVKLIERKTFKLDFKGMDEAGKFTGHAAVFGNRDAYGDIIERGAFVKTLQEKKRFPLLWQHDPKEVIGHVFPTEDDKGLSIEGQLILDVQRATEARALLQAGALSGLSIGYETIKQENEEGARVIKEIKLWEVSVVTFPANELAQVEDVKQVEVDEEDLESLELKKVIPYKNYGNADEDTPWDAGAQVREADVETLKKICAWYDSENPDLKSSYKLPHHRASDLKAVWRGVAAAMGALLGARGGVNIPDSDRKGVYNHLAKHYKDFEKEPPEFRSSELAEPEESTLNAEPAESHSAEEKKSEPEVREINIEIQEKEKTMELEEKVKNLEDEVNTLKSAGIRTSENKEDLYYKHFLNYLRTGEKIPDEFKTDYPIISGTDAQGGYLVPPAFYNKIIEKLVEFSPVRQYATVIRTNAREVKIPVENAGITVAWPGEAGERTHAITGSSFFAQVALTQYPQTALLKVSRQLLASETVFNAEDYIANLFARYIAQSEGTKFVSGDGSNCPTGLTHSTLVTAVETNAASTLAADDLISLYYAVPEPYRSRGVWLINDSIQAAIAKFKATSGEYLMHGYSGAPAPTLLGRPIISAPDLASTVADESIVAIFGDLSGYFISDNPNSAMLRLNELYAANGYVGFLFEFYKGGYPVDTQGIRKLKVKKATG